MLRTLLSSRRAAVRAIKRPVGLSPGWPLAVQVTPAAFWMAALAAALPMSYLGA